METINTLILKRGLLALTFCSPITVLAAAGPSGTTASSSDYAATPPAIVEGADPFLMIDLSVELTQQAEAYTDGAVTYGTNTCPDRLGGRGICYYSNFEYVGYFDPNKCYTYETSSLNTVIDQVSQSPYNDSGRNGVTSKPNPHYFKPARAANSDHTCPAGSNLWSGNYMNWATMSAIDTFRYAMTGGARMVDTIGASSVTLLIDNKDSSWSFVDKRIGTGADSQTNGGQTFDHDPRQLTPFDLDGLVAINPDGLGHRMHFEDNNGVKLSFGGVDEFNIIVQVCDPSVSLEANCVEYTDGTNTWYKPEGLLQQNSLNMRYALSSYLADNSHTRNGGVMRSLAKYIGYLRPAISGGLEVNPEAETDEQGRIVFNPGSVTIGSGVNNSGIINYINNFGLNGYKSFDPMAELYYESLRYIKNLGPTPEYSDLLTNAMKDNFPVITTWDDPVLNACQANYKLYVGDQFAWEDHNLPGMTSSIYNGPPLADRGRTLLPSNADTAYNAVTVTNTVGTLEGFSPYGLNLGATPRRNSSSSPVRNYNGWWVAGLAHYARTNDLRTDAHLGGDQTVKTFMVDTAEYSSSPPTDEDNPMWLAAKYGGFEDYNGDGDPNNGAGTSVSNSEWDADGDGVPDTFTVANQPDRLIQGLSDVFVDVTQSISSSSAASVVANSAGGTGAVYQAIYEPRIISGDGDVVDWTGRVVAFFIDDQSRLREDRCSGDGSTNDCNKALDTADPEIRFRIDSTTQKTVVDRYDISSGNVLASDVSFDNIDFIWDASDELAALTDAEAVTQRTYTTTADNGRYIFTAIDGVDGSTPDGKVTDAETFDFVHGQFPALDTNDSTLDKRRYLGFESGTEVVGGVDMSDALVRYIRGEDQGIAGARSRTIDRDNDGTKEVLRLGDIINSSPVVVGEPDAGYDFRYQDSTYAFFKKRYKDRRQMLYVGGNDGMLHAFNAGFYEPANKAFVTQLTSEAAHPLGSEMWAYVPQNLLPHLQWLPDLQYPHVYYVDGDVQTFDVNIFSDCSNINTCTHPHGWGTILVATMRFGGGDITIDPNSDSTDGNAGDDITMRSAIMIFDVTDPEQPPVLLAEMTDANMGFTTSKPTLMKDRPVDETTGAYLASSWKLIFGSGPAGSTGVAKAQALTDAVSDQPVRVYGIDLNGGDPQFIDYDTATTGVQPLVISSELNSFAGDFSTADWDNDYTDDAVYFGTVGGTVAAPTGHLWRWDDFVAGPNIMLNNSDLPITAAPRLLLDRRNRPWVYAGTGRFFVSDDILSTQQGSFYGIREPLDANGVPTYAVVDHDDLMNTTDVVVLESGQVVNPNGSSPVTVTNSNNSPSKQVTTASAVESFVSDNAGWVVNLGYTLGTQTLTGSRNLLQSVLLRGVVLLFDEYTPSGDTCDPAGSSRLFNLGSFSGIPSSKVFLDSQTDINNNDPNILPAIDMGVGQIIGIAAHKDSAIVSMGGGSGEAGFRMSSNKANVVSVPFGRRSWREIPLDGSM